MPCKKQLLFGAAIASLCVLTSIAKADEPSLYNMIFFGDSLVDVGNNTTDQPPAPITNNTHPDKRAYLWEDYLANELFQKPVHASSEANLDVMKDNISYAYAGAETGDSHDYDLQNQIKNYLASLKDQPINQNTLFFIWAGGNDLFAATSATSVEQVQSIIGSTVIHIANAKDLLVAHGAQEKNIYILNLPNLKWTPYVHNIVTSLGHPAGDALEENVNNISVKFNQILDQGLANKNIIIDIDNLMTRIEANPATYKVTQDVYRTCNNAPSCEGFLFYNEKHPTTMIHEWIARTIIDSYLKKRPELGA